MTDFSDAAQQALPLAAELANQFGATLSLVHVFPMSLPGELSHIGIVFEQKRLASEARLRLDRFRQSELPANLPVESVLLEGGPFSEASRPALRYAAAFAGPCGSEVALLHAIEPPPYPEFGYVHVPIKEAGLKREAAGKLEASCREFEQRGIKAGSVVRSGSAFWEVAQHAREQGIDLIVIGTHGRRAIAHALLGSTAERVVRHAPCAVLVVRQQEHDFVKE